MTRCELLGVCQAIGCPNCPNKKEVKMYYMVSWSIKLKHGYRDKWEFFLTLEEAQEWYEKLQIKENLDVASISCVIACTDWEDD
jgi:hypothetical protein